MKKWVILLLVVAVIAGSWYWIRTNYRVTMPWDMPKLGEVTRGDIEVPITAPGLIEPHQRVEVKSKASGEVIEILIVEGRYVKKDDVLIRLKPDDEQRSRDRAQFELDRAEALLAQAKEKVVQAKAGVTNVQAQLDELTQRRRIAESEHKRVTGLNAMQTTEQERINAEAQVKIIDANLQSTNASLDSARSTVTDAENAVLVQQSVVSSARKNLEDAEERLRETTIVAKQDALVTDVLVRPGEVIQSGVNSLTGGTVVTRLADISSKKVVARVDEADYGRVYEIAPLSARPQMNAGKAAESPTTSPASARAYSGIVKITVDAFPDEVFEGVIDRVEPQGNLYGTASVIQFDVHVVLTDPKEDMLPLGAQAQVEFTVESADDVLRVPSDAVKSHEGDRGIYVQVPPDPSSGDKWAYQFIPYTFGITDGTYTELIRPLYGRKPVEEKQKVYTKLPSTPRDDDR